MQNKSEAESNQPQWPELEKADSPPDPIEAWDQLDPSARLDYLVQLAKCQGFLHLVSAARNEEGRLLASLQKSQNSRDQDMFLKGKISGIAFFEHTYMQLLSEARDDIGEREMESSQATKEENLWGE